MRRFTQQCPELRALHAALRQRTQNRRAPLASLSRAARPCCSSGRRQFHSTSLTLREKPPSEPQPTSFQDLDMLGQIAVPSTSVDVCMSDGFALNSGITITGGDGALLVNGEAFAWRPWEIKGEKRMLNSKGQLDIPAEALSVFNILWPRPDLLIIGAGKQIVPLSPETRRVLSEMGIRVEVLDTRNAASQFNMLATERGIDDVAAVLIPLGWEEGVGAA
ncbi:hypothetical protein VHEMI08415 [[Torrubiella] hemipterigena]|uniref:NADH dehydrogenase [ubiquinone] 1 alpha subcomplex assembly factor 3 n=1 Tax=[Torrubiella] hemipterigena TaxID=1531966 RepID=A0A0A1TN63_9HYPO|nr:hypothetical protein VHEMI08415 [[Torrubiella] hemipterigena]